MRIELKETYKGEFESSPQELSEKLNKGLDELKYAFSKSKGGPDGSVQAIDELSDLLVASFEKRTERLCAVILDTLKRGPNND